MTINFLKEETKRKNERRKLSMTWLNDKMMNVMWPNEGMAKFVVDASAIIYYLVTNPCNARKNYLI